MKFPHFLLSLLSLSLPLSVLAARTPGFSMSAFNAAVPFSDTSGVFSPYAFELDCVALSEALGPAEKGRYIDALGAVIGYDGVYRPIIESYASSHTNGFRLVSARAFLVPAFTAATPEYRALVQDEYNVQVCRVKPSAEGAECYLKAAMDGEMEDFSLPKKIVRSDRISFVDLESLRLSVPTGTPTAALWRTPRFTMLRLSLYGGLSFFAVQPAGESTLESIRGEFAAEKFNTAVTVLRSVTEDGVYHGPVDVDIQPFAIRSSKALVPVFRSADLPVSGFTALTPGGELEDIRQVTVFSFAGFNGRTSASRGSAAPASVPMFSGAEPFLFFVYHEPTRTVPAAGVFTGGGK